MAQLPLDIQWFPGKVTTKSGSGSTAVYGWVRRWVEGDLATHSVANMPGVASGSTTDLAGVCITGADLSIGADVLARPAPGAGGTLYELVPVGSSGGSAQDCGSLSGLYGNLCLSATVTSSANCLDIDGTYTLRNSGNGHWLTVFPLPGGIGNSQLNFTPGNTSTKGDPFAWFSGFEATNMTMFNDQLLTLADCAGGALTFKGGGPWLCEPYLRDCPPQKVEVTINCGNCPLPTTDYLCANYSNGVVAYGRDCWPNTTIQQDPSNWTLYGNLTWPNAANCYLANCTANTPPTPPPVANTCASHTVPGRLYATTSNVVTQFGDLSCIIDETYELNYAVVGGAPGRWYAPAGVDITDFSPPNAWSLGVCGGAGGFMYIEQTGDANCSWFLNTNTDATNDATLGWRTDSGNETSVQISWSPFLLVISGIIIEQANPSVPPGTKVGRGTMTVTISELPP